jgi:hypothetical protein
MSDHHEYLTAADAESLRSDGGFVSLKRTGIVDGFRVLLAEFADPWPPFEEPRRPSRETTVVHELVTNGAPRPASSQQGYVPIETLAAHLARTRLDPQQHRFPVATGFP